jgi:prepilin-type N-terminal cleavage/methylation domain-containing protein
LTEDLENSEKSENNFTLFYFGTFYRQKFSMSNLTFPLAPIGFPPSNLRGLSRARGFTLIELLVVLAIIALLAVAMTPAFNAFAGANALTKAASDISSTLEYARAYAMANSTYVYVGFQEVDGIKPTSTDGTGRLMVDVIASSNGTRPYTSLSGAAPSITTNVIQINKIEALDNVHLAAATTLTNGNMSTRPVAAVDLSSIDSTASFQWPLTNPAFQNMFKKVIEFDPQGTARVQTGANFDSSISNYIEIPLVTAHGDQAPTTQAQLANQAAVQVDGMTGALRTYRP